MSVQVVHQIKKEGRSRPSPYLLKKGGARRKKKKNVSKDGVGGDFPSRITQGPHEETFRKGRKTLCDAPRMRKKGSKKKERGHGGQEKGKKYRLSKKKKEFM